jgi:hypothetical protein
LLICTTHPTPAHYYPLRASTDVILWIIVPSTVDPCVTSTSRRTAHPSESFSKHRRTLHSTPAETRFNDQRASREKARISVWFPPLCQCQTHASGPPEEERRVADCQSCLSGLSVNLPRAYDAIPRYCTEYSYPASKEYSLRRQEDASPSK